MRDLDETNRITAEGVLTLLDEHLPHNPEHGWFSEELIPERKLRNAVMAYARGAERETVLALGDGTAFGSAKEGVLITDKRFYANTSEGRFSLRFAEILRAEKLSGFPAYEITVVSAEGERLRVSMACFEKMQDRLISFLNCLNPEPQKVRSRKAGISTAPPASAPAPPPEPESREEAPTIPLAAEIELPDTWEPEPVEPESEIASEPIQEIEPLEIANASAQSQQDAEDQVKPPMDEAVEQAVTSELPSIQVEEADATLDLVVLYSTDQHKDLNSFLLQVFDYPRECMILKGYCQYLDEGQTPRDGIFYLTNRRYLLFSVERIAGHLSGPLLLLGKIGQVLERDKDKVIVKILRQNDTRFLSDPESLDVVDEETLTDLGRRISALDLSQSGDPSATSLRFIPRKGVRDESMPFSLLFPSNDLASFFPLLTALVDSLQARGHGIDVDKNHARILFESY